MAILAQSVDYTDRDFASLRTRLQALIRSAFPTWTDFQVTNFQNILIEFFAWSGDVLGFYQDSQAAEAFITSAVQRRSLLKLATLLGYKPLGAAASQTDEQFTATGLTVNCILPAGTQISTLDASSPVEFQTLSPLTLTPGAPVGTVTVENSKTVPESFLSSLQANQRIVLSQTPYLDKSASIVTPQGTFTEVASFVNSGSSDKVFVVQVDNNDRATIVFGDGVTAGLIPTGTINASYKVGGGASGNVTAGSVLKVLSSVLDVSGNPVTLACTNPSGATGGVDRQSVESIRESAPESITAPLTTVARKDFEIHAKTLASVDRALMLTAREDVTIPENEGFLFLVSPGAFGPDKPSPVLKDTARRLFASDDDLAPYPMLCTFKLTVLEAVFVDVDIVARVYLKRNAVATTVKAEILSALSAFFATKNADGSSNTEIDFGYYLRNVNSATTPAPILAESSIVDVIRDVPGVRELKPALTEFTLAATRQIWDSSGLSWVSSTVQTASRQDVTLDLRDFPRLGTVSLINGDTGAAL